MSAAASVEAPVTTYAALVWPEAGAGRRSTLVRAAALMFLGSCLLTLSAKLQVPGPIPMTLQTLAVLALGAMLGARIAVASVLLYLMEGALGLPVFASTPPLVAGPAYLLGPTGGFLLGFIVAAGLTGYAADRGFARRPLVFALWLTAASVAMLVAGCLWLALVALPSGGLARAFEVGVRPFLLGHTIKVALAATALPLVLEMLRRIIRR